MKRAERGTVLLITYYFPPAGGPGVQRMLKFAKYLPACGWRPVVLTVREDADYPVRDPSLAMDIPDGITVCRTGITEFYKSYRRMTGTSTPLEGTPEGAGGGFLGRILRGVRASLFIPDGRIGWIPHAVGPGARLARREKADVIMSSGPPFTANVIGGLIARRTGLPWVQDLRDPWTRAPYYPERPSPAGRIDESIERWALRRAARTLAVNRNIFTDFERRYPDLDSRRFIVLPNGFDEADFEGIERRSPQKLTFVHAGTLHAARDPRGFREAMADLCESEAGFAESVEIVLAGRVEDGVLKAMTSPPLDRIVRMIGYVDHRSSLQLLREAHICLLCIGDEPEVRGMLTGKVFEYLGSETPILAFGPTDGEAADLLAKTESGVILPVDDRPAARSFILDAWRRFRAGEKIGRTPNAGEIARYGRRALTLRLAGVLDEVRGESE